MNWILPGTTLPGKRDEAEQIEGQFRSMFLAGGIVLSQVASISGLEAYTIQNWVKRGFLSPPVKKKYNMDQLCRILTIHMLKSALPMEEICSLLTYVNGQLDTAADDLISDARLYFLFVRLAAHYSMMKNEAGRDNYLEQVMAQATDLSPVAADRVRQVLRIMLTAWASSLLRQQAENMVLALKKPD